MGGETEPCDRILRQLHVLADKFDRLADDVRDIKARVTAIDGGLAGVNRRLDRMEAGLERIELLDGG